MLFALPAVSPLFALTPTLEAHLPACCRRAGAHHCMATMQMPDAKTPTFAPVPACCRSYPQHTVAVAHTDLATPTSALLFAEIVSHPALHRQTQARARVALDRARHKRGPPQASL
jgi:hypothetical protein